MNFHHKGQGGGNNITKEGRKKEENGWTQINLQERLPHYSSLYCTYNNGVEKATSNAPNCFQIEPITMMPI